MGRARVGVIVIAASMAGCSIEHTKALGDECIQDRECVTPLACLPSAGGAYRCSAVFEGGLPGAIDAAPSDAATSDAVAPIDASDVLGDAAPQMD